jgi:RNA ligase
MKFDLDKINDYINNGLIIKQNHPTYPLSIYNYSRECQYNNQWDKLTLSCRGLILNNEGHVIAKSFDKFFNLSEHDAEHIPNDDFEVFTKMDGSLGILFYYDNKWNVASRGSFNSEVSNKANEIIKKYNILDEHSEITKFTIIGEIIYNENRIVVNYGDMEEFVILTIIDPNTGTELPYDDVVKIGQKLNMPVVKRYDGISDYRTLKNSIQDNEEGYIVRFKNNFRIKIKGDEYLRLHKLRTDFSVKRIWEMLYKNESFDYFLQNVPDEFDLMVKNTIKEIMDNYSLVEDEYLSIFKEINNENIKIFANEAKKYNNSHILFNMWNKKSNREPIFKLLKPTQKNVKD